MPSGASLSVVNADTGQSVATETDFTTGTWTGGASASFTFPDINGGILPDGNYYGLFVNEDPSTQAQVSLGSADFFVLSADANHDRRVNALDFNALSTYFGSSDATFSQGDFNYDGTVNSSDFNLLASNYNKTLIAPRPVPVAGTMASYAAPSIALDWSDNPEAGVTYNVYRGSDPEFIPDPTSNQIATGLTASNFTDTTVGANTRYYYKVTAVVAGRESFANEVATQITAVDQQPANLIADVADEQRVEFSWDDQSSNETGYTVEAIDSGNNVVQSASLPADSTSYVFTGLQEDSDYTFQVSASFGGAAPALNGPSTPAHTATADSMVGLIIVILGHNDSLSDHTSGMANLTRELRADNFLGNGLHYRVWRVAESDFVEGGAGITWDGFGPVYDQALNLLEQNGTRDVGIIGYSHGGGIVHRLAANLLAQHQFSDIWGIRYSATIDAIQRGPVDNFLPAFAETAQVSSELQDNFYNDMPFDLFKNPLKGGPVPLANNFARNDTHYTIDDDPQVHATIKSDVETRIRPS